MRMAASKGFVPAGAWSRAVRKTDDVHTPVQGTVPVAIALAHFLVADQVAFSSKPAYTAVPFMAVGLSIVPWELTLIVWPPASHPNPNSMGFSFTDPVSLALPTTSQLEG